jgi:hypothetical protein
MEVYGESGALPSKFACNFIALDVVVGSNSLDMYYVGGVGDEMYDFFNKEFV